MVVDVPELKVRDRLRGVTWQDSARRCDVQGAATPSADTRLWKTRVRIRQHRVDHDGAAVDAPQTPQMGDRLIDLLARGHERRAVLQSPAVVLHVGNFD